MKRLFLVIVGIKTSKISLTTKRGRNSPQIELNGEERLSILWALEPGMVYVTKKKNLSVKHRPK